MSPLWQTTETSFLLSVKEEELEGFDLREGEDRRSLEEEEVCGEESFEQGSSEMLNFLVKLFLFWWTTDFFILFSLSVLTVFRLPCSRMHFSFFCSFKLSSYLLMTLVILDLDFWAEDLKMLKEEERGVGMLKEVGFWGIGLKMGELVLKADILFFLVSVKEGFVRTVEESWLMPKSPGIRKLFLCVVRVLATFLFLAWFSFPLQHCPRQVLPWLQKGQKSEEAILGSLNPPPGFWWQSLVKSVTRVEGDSFSWFYLTSVEGNWGGSHPAGPPVSTCCWVGFSHWLPTSPPPAGPRTSCWGGSEGSTGDGGQMWKFVVLPDHWFILVCWFIENLKILKWLNLFQNENHPYLIYLTEAI